MEDSQLTRAFQTSPFECLDSPGPFHPHHLLLEQLQAVDLEQATDYESKLHQKASDEH